METDIDRSNAKRSEFGSIFAKSANGMDRLRPAVGWSKKTLTRANRSSIS